MTTQNHNQTISIPADIKPSIAGARITLTGTKGEVSKDFLHPKIKIALDGNDVVFKIEKYSKSEKKILNTFIAHLKNMCKGAMQGHEYKLKICSGHFPMNVSVKGAQLEVKNFIGEAVPRKLSFKDGVEVKLNGDIITVTSVSKELAGQTAASIEKLTRRNGFDRRNFQDGIYITEKDGKTV